MSRLRFFYKITRPAGVGSAFFGTWVSASMCQASPTDRLYASVVMGLSVLASSLFHYGSANQMYSRKYWDRVDIRRPHLFVATGIAVFTAAVGISDWLLPRGCVSITWFNVVAVSLYGIVLSKQWYTKNITMALVCTTPVIMGWWVGTTTNPAILYITLFVGCAHYGREVVKDVQDREANCGIRVTLPIRFTPQDAQRFAGVVIAGSALFAFLLSREAWGAAAVGVLLLGVAIRLLLCKGTGRIPAIMTGAMIMLIIAFAR